MKVFQRALQYSDPKKVHLALLGVYERTEQHKLGDELLEKMVKKFKHSCKVLMPEMTREILWVCSTFIVSNLESFYPHSGLAEAYTVATKAKPRQHSVYCKPCSPMSPQA